MRRSNHRSLRGPWPRNWITGEWDAGRISGMQATDLAHRPTEVTAEAEADERPPVGNGERTIKILGNYAALTPPEWSERAEHHAVEQASALDLNEQAAGEVELTLEHAKTAWLCYLLRRDPEDLRYARAIYRRLDAQNNDEPLPVRAQHADWKTALTNSLRTLPSSEQQIAE